MWSWDRRVQGLLVILAAALIFAGGVKYARWQAAHSPGSAVLIDEKKEAGENSGGATESPPEQVGVHVTGAVGKPGVYYFPRGTRVVAAVEKAGPLPQADLNSLNLARLLADGEQIYVPRQGEMPPPSQAGFAGSGGTSGPQGKVNLNTASAAELDARLPGIGPTLAQRIVDYRASHGPFRSIEDLQNVSGIGPRRFEQIKDLVTI
ncbi:MAG: ComEA family DNA-binding protein [Firmicutes bacterium]|nr:ComEA family DNA-binding protein [Bacillota bacterium]